MGEIKKRWYVVRAISGKEKKVKVAMAKVAKGPPQTETQIVIQTSIIMPRENVL